MQRRTLSASVAVMQGTTWLGAARSFTVLVALGGALPYGTLSPCWCRKHLKNRTSFHDAYTQPARAGSDPAFSFLSSRVSESSAPYKSRPVVIHDNTCPLISYRAASSRVTVLYQQHCVFRNPCTSRYNQRTAHSALWLSRTCVCTVHSLYCPCGRYWS